MELDSEEAFRIFLVSGLPQAYTCLLYTSQSTPRPMTWRKTTGEKPGTADRV